MQELNYKRIGEECGIQIKYASYETNSWNGIFSSNSEYLNLGSQFTFSPTHRTKFHLRSGYKGLYMVDGEFGPAFGCGMQYQLNSGQGIKLDYSYRSIITFNNTHNYTLSLTF